MVRPNFLHFLQDSLDSFAAGPYTRDTAEESTYGVLDRSHMLNPHQTSRASIVQRNRREIPIEPPGPLV